MLVTELYKRGSMVERVAGRDRSRVFVYLLPLSSFFLFSTSFWAVGGNHINADRNASIGQFWRPECNASMISFFGLCSKTLLRGYPASSHVVYQSHEFGPSYLMYMRRSFLTTDTQVV